MDARALNWTLPLVAHKFTRLTEETLIEKYLKPRLTSRAQNSASLKAVVKVAGE
jgi:hypothetical protein